MSNIQDINNIPKLQSPFEQLREVDADGKEWWNSRKLARVMGYGKYWNFERVIAKAQAWTSQKGYHLGEHFVEITEMAELGSGAVRGVTNTFGFLSREWQNCLALHSKTLAIIFSKLKKAVNCICPMHTKKFCYLRTNGLVR